MIPSSSSNACAQAPDAPWMSPAGEPGLVSVVVPAYNRAHYLPELIQSVVDQTYRPIELLIVDDGSMDDTEAVVEAWMDEDTGSHDLDGVSLRYIYQENQGAPVARNRGLVESQGEYIQFLDSDDLLHPQKFDVQVQALTTFPSADVVWAPSPFFEDGQRPPFRTVEPSRIVREAELTPVHRPPQASHPETMLYRRSACRDIGPWSTELERWQDWDYCFRIVRADLVRVRVPGQYYFLREHDTGKIGDLRFGREGVRRNLVALRSIDETIRDMEQVHPSTRRTIFNLYLNTLQRALEADDEDSILRVLSRAKAYGRHMQLQLVGGIYRAFGASTAHAVIRTYMRLKAPFR